MQQFKVGDKVVRFRDPWFVSNVGVVGTVADVPNEKELRVKYDGEDYAKGYDSCNFKLVSTTTPHKHSELIKQWADGAKVQVKTINGEWSDTQMPIWHEDNEYRIKPEPKPDYYTYLVIHNRCGLTRTDTLEEAREQLKNKKDFSIIRLTHDGETGTIKHSEVVE